MAAFAVVVVAGVLGYRLLGLGFFDAFYMTVITVSTVGFHEVGTPEQIDDSYRAFTVVLLLLGVGTALYTLSVTLETLLESRLSDRFRRRRMDREITTMVDHVVVAGTGGIGQHHRRSDWPRPTGRSVVVSTSTWNASRDVPHHHILGDGTDDEALDAAGVATARPSSPPPTATPTTCT